MEEGELTYIKVDYPDAKDLHLQIVTPICSLVTSPGIGNAWVTGRYNDPKIVAPLQITQKKNRAQIMSFGAFAYRTPKRFLPDMKLSFGRLHPFSLSISAGAMNDHLDFGGIPLTALDLEYESGSQLIDFSYPNPEVMSLLKITGDTGPIEIMNAANANAEKFFLSGDSTRFKIQFGSALKRNTTLRIGLAVQSAEISIPSGTAVKIKPGSHPVGSQAEDFLHEDKAYLNTPARDHQEPLLLIQCSNSVHFVKLDYI